MASFTASLSLATEHDNAIEKPSISFPTASLQLVGVGGRVHVETPHYQNKSVLLGIIAS